MFFFLVFFFSCIDGRNLEDISFSKQIVTDSILTKIKKTNRDFLNDLYGVIVNFGEVDYFFLNISYKSIYDHLKDHKKEYEKITFNEFVYILSNLEKEIYNHNI